MVAERTHRNYENVWEPPGAPVLGLQGKPISLSWRLATWAALAVLSLFFEERPSQ